MMKVSNEAMMTKLARVAQAYRMHSPSLFSFYTLSIMSVQLANILIFLHSSERWAINRPKTSRQIDPDELQETLNVYLAGMSSNLPESKPAIDTANSASLAGFLRYQNTGQ